jgi:cell division protein FtsB
MNASPPSSPRHSADVPDSATPPAPRIARRGRLTNMQIILIVVIVIGMRLALDFGRRIAEGQRVTADQRTLETEIQALRDEQATLEANVAYHSSDAFVEDWAHDQGKMVLEGEVLVVPIPEGEALPSEAMRPQVAESLSKWQVWRSLFFDSPSPSGGNARQTTGP